MLDCFKSENTTLVARNTFGETSRDNFREYISSSTLKCVEFTDALPNELSGDGLIKLLHEIQLTRNK